MEIMQHIHIIIAAVVMVLADIAAVIAAVRAIVKHAQGLKDASAEEKAEAKEAVKANLKQIIFSLVTDAEKELGGGTGKLKSARVAAWVYDKIPDILKPLFSAEDIQGMIETVLKEAQEYWSKNAKAREYIDSGTPVLLTAESGETAATGVEDIVKAVGDRIGEAIARATESPQSSEKAADDKNHPADGQNVVTEAQGGPKEGKTEPSAE